MERKRAERNSEFEHPRSSGETFVTCSQEANLRNFQPFQTTDAKTIEALEATITTQKKTVGTTRAQFLWAPELDLNAFQTVIDEPDLFNEVKTTVCRSRQDVIYKIMPGGRHEQLTRRFESLISHCLANMSLTEIGGHFEWLGSARYSGICCSKEPDSTFVPGQVNVAAGWTPSLVIETGYSESIHQLRADAHWWYNNTSPKTKTVILIHAGRSPTWTVTVEIWEEIESPRRSTRAMPSPTIDCTQTVRIQNGVVFGGNLVINFSRLMRRPTRHPIENDIVLNAGLLQRLA